MQSELDSSQAQSWARPPLTQGARWPTCPHPSQNWTSEVQGDRRRGRKTSTHHQKNTHCKILDGMFELKNPDTCVIVFSSGTLHMQGLKTVLKRGGLFCVFLILLPTFRKSYRCLRTPIRTSSRSFKNPLKMGTRSAAVN